MRIKNKYCLEGERRIIFNFYNYLLFFYGSLNNFEEVKVFKYHNFVRSFDKRILEFRGNFTDIKERVYFICG